MFHWLFLTARFLTAKLDFSLSQITFQHILQSGTFVLQLQGIVKALHLWRRLPHTVLLDILDMGESVKATL